ncbi:hypothetical protein EAF04_009892 [Stromatinia cepivora]|nr:hypothetical protein EAF04_009892 [Stromatinia cepivora]
MALMIHGGGHMTLSRKAVRPFQTRYLLANGFLSVSIDYRLCPKVNLIDGPVADVYDGYRWTQNILPKLAAKRGIHVKADKVVVIGWSTGGHLAMSIGWTAKKAGTLPPLAVLSFYSPADFESGELDTKRLSKIPGRKMNIEQIISALPRTPITNYDSDETDGTSLGWVRPGDPRSELVLALFKEGIGLPLLLNGLPVPKSMPAEWFVAPTAAQIASIRPLAQLRKGTYNVPTFVIHGSHDQIAPFSGAQRFVTEMRKRNITHGFLPLYGVDHIHDLNLRPTSLEWDAKVEPGYQFLFTIARDHV